MCCHWNRLEVGCEGVTSELRGPKNSIPARAILARFLLSLELLPCVFFLLTFSEAGSVEQFSQCAELFRRLCFGKELLKFRRITVLARWPPRPLHSLGMIILAQQRVS